MWVNRLLWLIYVALLGVLLPHTAWAFSHFEPNTDFGIATAWFAAFAFEAAIAALTHKLAKHIEQTPRRAKGLSRFSHRYLNAYALGLSVAILVSVLANLAHAVEFGMGLTIFAEYSVPDELYAVAFGAILPGVSLLFARVLSNVVEAEAEEDPELLKAKTAIKELKASLKESERERSGLVDKLAEAEQRFAAAGELFAKIFAETKRERILAVSRQWPQLPPGSVAMIAEASPSYVSEVLSDEAQLPRRLPTQADTPPRGNSPAGSVSMRGQAGSQAGVK